MLTLLKDLARRAGDALARKVAGKLDPVVEERKYPGDLPGQPSRLVLDDQDYEPRGTLPPGHPVVSFSPRALEMQSAVRRAHEARRAAPEPPKPGPRPGSFEWRVQQARGLK